MTMKLALDVLVAWILLQQEHMNLKEQFLKETLHYRIVVKGGNGGHSGMDIHKGIANANKLLNRVMIEALESVDFRISAINGGGLRNAIPREAEATIVVASEDANEQRGC